MNFYPAFPTFRVFAVGAHSKYSYMEKGIVPAEG